MDKQSQSAVDMLSNNDQNNEKLQFFLSNNFAMSVKNQICIKALPKIKRSFFLSGFFLCDQGGQTSNFRADGTKEFHPTA